MLSLDIPEFSLKAVTPRKKKRKSKKTPDSVLQLGSKERIETLPEEVTEEFVQLYRKELDTLLLPYVVHGVYTLSQANDYADLLVSCVFGNDSHLGLFQYVKSRSSPMSDKDLVVYCERLLIKGWSIRQRDDGTWWIFNDSLQDVSNVTGEAKVSQGALEFTPENAHLFLSEESASRVQRLSMGEGFDADSLASLGSLELVLSKSHEDLSLFGLITNYSRMRDVLRKRGSYYTDGEDGLTLMSMYSKGFRFDPRVVSEGVTMSHDGKRYILYAVSDETNDYMNADLGSVLGSRIRDSLETRGVVWQSLQEVKDMNRVFALLTEYFEVEPSSWKDNVDRIRRLGNEGGVIRSKVYSSLAVAIVTDAILLGNANFNFSRVGVDTVSGKLFSYSSRDYFTTTTEDLAFLTRNLVDVDALTRFEPFLEDVYPFRMTSVVAREKLSGVFKLLPSEYFSALGKVEFPKDGYGLEFPKPQEYFESARELIMSYA